MLRRDLASIPSLGLNGGQKVTRLKKRQYNETYHVTPVRPMAASHLAVLIRCMANVLSWWPHQCLLRPQHLQDIELWGWQGMQAQLRRS